MIILAGASHYAYETDILMKYADSTGLENVVYNIHPYMGPWQNSDQTKTPKGFAKTVEAIQMHNRPVISTEFGQYCCPDPLNEGVDTGVCSDAVPSPCEAAFDGLCDGQPCGYNDALLGIMAKKAVSWTMWSWVPGDAASCAYPMVNAGTEIIGRTAVGPLANGTVSGGQICGGTTVTIVDQAGGMNASALLQKYYTPSSVLELAFGFTV